MFHDSVVSKNKVAPHSSGQTERPRRASPARALLTPVPLSRLDRRALAQVRRGPARRVGDLARLLRVPSNDLMAALRRLESAGMLHMHSSGWEGTTETATWTANPDALLTLGLKVGRRSNELVLVNWSGQTIRHLRRAHDIPDPAGALDFAQGAVAEVLAALGTEMASRIAGMGVVEPTELLSWPDDVGMTSEEVENWLTFDFRGELARRFAWPLHFEGEASAACVGEMTFGASEAHSNHLYVFVGSSVGGGLVIDERLYRGPSGRASAIGSMPVDGYAASRSRLGARRLTNVASIPSLERRMMSAGLNPGALCDTASEWTGDNRGLVDEWIAETAGAIAQSVAAAISLLDIPAVMVDGAFPPQVRQRLVAAIRESLQRMWRRGTPELQIVEGTLGAQSRVMGAAALPLATLAD